MTRSEISRQLVHIGAGAPAFTLAWLSWPQAAAMAGAAVVFNLTLLPRVSPRILRDADLDRRWTSGTVLYPLAVLGLVVVFRNRLDLAAAAWGILAAGDGMATLVGTSLRSAPLPWNREKSVAGLVAFVLAGSAAAVGLLAWTTGTPVSVELVATGGIAATVAGLVETIPIRLDDNISVPIAAAFVLWSCSLFDAALLATRWPDVQVLVLYGLIANVIVALAGWAAHTVTVPGAVTGAVIGTLVVAGSGWRGWAMLLTTFIVASASTRLGRGRKAAAGIAEARGGRRGPGNAIANTGLAAWASVMSLGLAVPAPAWLVSVAALATAGSDTVASEIGKAYGRTTWMVTTFRRVLPGTTGAVSFEGTAAGMFGAAVLAAVGAGLGLVPAWTIPLITAAATVASLVEGLLGATFEARGILNNDTLNFVNAALGAAIALAAWTWWPW